MQKVNLDKQSIIFFGLVFFLLIELFLFLPVSIKKIGNLNNEVSKVAQKVKMVKKEWPNKSQYLIKKHQLQMEIESMGANFILDQQESKLLSFISTSSKHFNVDISTLSPGKSDSYILEGPEDLEYLPIYIEAKSRFHNIARFLEHIQSSQYFFEIKKLNIFSKPPFHNVDMVICGLRKKNQF